LRLIIRRRLSMAHNIQVHKMKNSIYGKEFRKIQKMYDKKFKRLFEERERQKSEAEVKNKDFVINY
jgi:hypothetical protein